MSYDIIKIRSTDDGIFLVPVTLKVRPYERKEQENTIRIQMFSDYSCPWCFLAEKYLASLDYDIQIEYIGIEQHPNIPINGELIEPGSCLKNTIRRINYTAKRSFLILSIEMMMSWRDLWIRLLWKRWNICCHGATLVGFFQNMKL